MTILPLHLLIGAIPVGGVLAYGLTRWRPEWSGRRIMHLAAVPGTLAMFAMAVSMEAYRGSPEDWEGLTHALAPLIFIVIITLQHALGFAGAAIVLRQVRPRGGYIE